MSHITLVVVMLDSLKHVVVRHVHVGVYCSPIRMFALVEERVLMRMFVNVMKAMKEDFVAKQELVQEWNLLILRCVAETASSVLNEIIVHAYQDNMTNLDTVYLSFALESRLSWMYHATLEASALVLITVFAKMVMEAQNVNTLLVEMFYKMTLVRALDVENAWHPVLANVHQDMKARIVRYPTASVFQVAIDLLSVRDEENVNRRIVVSVMRVMLVIVASMLKHVLVDSTMIQPPVIMGGAVNTMFVNVSLVTLVLCAIVLDALDMMTTVPMLVLETESALKQTLVHVCPVGEVKTVVSLPALEFCLRIPRFVPVLAPVLLPTSASVN